MSLLNCPEQTLNRRFFPFGRIGIEEFQIDFFFPIGKIGVDDFLDRGFSIGKNGIDDFWIDDFQFGKWKSNFRIKNFYQGTKKIARRQRKRIQK